jgi:hypothetical protein
MQRRDLWAGHITAEDYERHMAATGQPQANADLLAELFRDSPPAPGARILFAGAGTGQYFDHFSSAGLAPYRPIFTDLNPRFLDRLAARLACQTLVDDIEAPRVEGPFWSTWSGGARWRNCAVSPRAYSRSFSRTPPA